MGKQLIVVRESLIDSRGTRIPGIFILIWHKAKLMNQINIFVLAGIDRYGIYLI